jgi:hypothetical protein
VALAEQLELGVVVVVAGVPAGVEREPEFACDRGQGLASSLGRGVAGDHGHHDDRGDEQDDGQQAQGGEHAGSVPA